jgi:AcrR family transcriptional regulator
LSYVIQEAAVRENNRTKILDAALRVVQRTGADQLTLESTAEEAGVTRGGMTYHFRDRAALNLALQEHLAAGWEDRLSQAAGKQAEQATPQEKSAAYAKVAMTELELILQAGRDPSLNAPWRRAQQRWAPTIEEAMASHAAMRLFVIRLAADGLWMYDALSGETLSGQMRAAIADAIAVIMDDAEST